MSIVVVGNNPAVIGTARPIGHNGVVVSLVYFLEEKLRLSGFVSSEGERYQILTLNKQVIILELSKVLYNSGIHI